ncbi:unnamed protein product [Prorocentrum cordatum]|uniref:ISXO2-like transposase domain-containing protein n=1 Tax=Prorocentrum cordatum TaxID=2364126 RepID=A0ABN9XEM4_9DINO|nr:unnamed protein product [Polarella glacialis]
MAAINPAVVLPDSLGTSLGLPGYAPGLTFGEALQHIENMKANDHPRVHVSRLDTAGHRAIADLPAQFATGKMIVHFADYLGDYEGDIQWGTLRDCAKTCDFKNMPEPFSLKKEPPGQYSMQVMGFIPDKYTCPCCGGNDYDVVHRKDKSAVFEGAQCKSWMDFLDVMTTRLYDYPKLIMGNESERHHCVIDRWVSTFQTKVASALHAAMASNGFWPKTNKKQKRKRGVQAKSRARVRAVAKAAAVRRNAGVGPRKKSEIKNYKIVAQVDEAHLNKRKPGRLARAARPQKDQVWAWGATVQGRPDVWLFRVLDHPLDAFNGKPRGRDEMLTNMHLLLKKGTVLVSDSWGATISAVKEFKKLKRWTAKDLRHELVAHSAGEIVNPNGFTTNGIEAVWSVVKRWVRRRCGGRMPSHSDREQWRAQLAELQWRKMNAHKTLDWGHTYFVPFAALAAACKPLE